MNPYRRKFLRNSGAGFSGLALASMLAQEGVLGAECLDELSKEGAPKAVELGARVAAKAKYCIFLYMYGGPSQMDLFDYKPELQKRDGQSVQIELRRNEIKEGKLLGSKRKFQQHGQSGLWCSDAFPNIAKHMDKLAVVKSLYQDSFAHGSANLQMNTGRILQGYPSIGSWLSYGLGSENRNLPNFVV
ncbi:MAG: DUF1501 domain-containing protein, partial [Pirellula sp.]